MKIRIDNPMRIIDALLAQEDTDGSKTITIDDTGPQCFLLQGSDGKRLEVKGHYRLANLLQELHLAAEAQQTQPGTVLIDTDLIDMPPLTRIEHLMRTHYWPTLTRRNDETGLLASLPDEKRHSDRHYLYVPAADDIGMRYYSAIAARHANIEIIPLPAPEALTDADLARIEARPGLLALKVDAQSGQPLPYVVPGGRFNEMYGWDSYFIALGLIAHDQFELARGTLENMAYQIRHYGQVLNANRSYYLTRSHPPFYTPFLRAFLDAWGDRMAAEWIGEHLDIALREYDQVWMNPATRLTAIGLNRYFSAGKGRPTETEPGHFDFALKKYAQKHGIDVREFERRHDAGEIIEPELDAYFIHDRSMRESGLDTTTRFDNCCADLACVDLNSLLYRVETDLAELIARHADGRFLPVAGGGLPDKLTADGAPSSRTTEEFRQRAERRKALMTRYLWNEGEGTWHDYNVRTGKPQRFPNASNLLPLWAGCCTPEQAAATVKNELPLVLRKGGIAATGPIPDKHAGPDRQWDYPHGWAPHQIMIWEGLRKYGFVEQASAAAFAWLQMVVQAAVDYNGLITEKFNVETASHKVDAEYGNVGARFAYIPAGGFGWTNASILLGLRMLDDRQKAQLNALAAP